MKINPVFFHQTVSADRSFWVSHEMRNKLRYEEAWIHRSLSAVSVYNDFSFQKRYLNSFDEFQGLTCNVNVKDFTQLGRERQRERYNTMNLITLYNDFTWECNQLASFPSSSLRHVHTRNANATADVRRRKRKDIHTSDKSGASDTGEVGFELVFASASSHIPTCFHCSYVSVCACVCIASVNTPLVNRTWKVHFCGFQRM